jgi:HPt (histidine-containing phosphotransfer) domain-containing protein
MKLPHYCFVVLLLSKASTQNIDACVAAGADHYLVKPLHAPDITNALAEYHQKAQQRTPLPDTLENKSIPAAQETHFQPVPYESLTGFDTAGLHNLEFMLGSKDKVFSTLKHFIIDFNGIVDEIKTSFHAQQKEVARRKLHSLKGTAAIVGANTLSILAAEIEAQVFISENIDHQLTDLNVAWQTVNNTVSTMF